MSTNYEQLFAQSLEELGYEGEHLDALLSKDLLDSDGLSTPFRELVIWLTSELADILKLDERIHPNSDGVDFLLELSSLLKEMDCPYSSLLSGSSADRFKTKSDRIQLFQYLTAELMAAKMNLYEMHGEKTVIEIDETPAARALNSIMQNLEVAEPASDISEKDIFEQILNHFGNIKKSWGEPLLKPSQSLSPEDWAKLEALQLELDKEYNLRCEMMMTRLRVTVKSFEWNSTKEALGSLAARYTEKLKMLDDLVSVHKETDIVDLMAARTDLLIIQKTSSELVRRNTQSKLQKHIIGRVPDRGGRTNEHQIPAPEMPQWQKNRSMGGGQGGNRGGGNQGGHQGGQQRQQRQFNQSNYQPQGPHQYAGNSNNKNSNHYQNANSGGNNRGGRVQGGWNQSGSGNQYGHQNSQDYGNQQYQQSENYLNRNNPDQQQYQDYNRDGTSYGRGRSNYNRGGRR